MRRVWLMLRKDLLRQVRAPLAMLLMLAFPLVFAGLMALAFGGGEARVPRVRLLVQDLDDTLLSGFMVGAFQNEQFAEYFDVEQVGEEGTALIEGGKASALLRIPEGFGQRLLGGEPVRLELVRNPAQGILPEIAEQTLLVATELLDSGSRLLRAPLDELRPYLDGDRSPEEIDVQRISSAFYRFFDGAGNRLFPPVITLKSVQLGNDDDDQDEDTGGAGFSIFAMVLPGISVWAIFVLGDIAMRDLLTEARLRTLRRQLAAPLPAWEIVLEKALFAATAAGCGLIVLSLIGWIALGRGVDPAGFVAVALALVLAVAGFTSVVYSLARTERQGATFSSVILLVFAFLGGSFVPVGSLPAAVLQAAPLSPFYWGNTGFSTLIRDGGGLSDVLVQIGVLAGFGGLLLMVGALLMERKVRRGLGA